MTVIIDGSTGIVGATWTTAGRPSSPAVGQRGFNTTTNAAIHTFLSSGTFTPAFVGEVDYLVVGGGGGAAASGNTDGGTGGGGGAGGFRTATGFAVAATGLTVTVGAGGASVTADNAVGNIGSNSVFSSITALGGGYGGKSATAAGAGGSGGGGGSAGGAVGTSGTGGNDGGLGSTDSSSYDNGGGGGGASAVGAAATSTVAGAGGAGTASSYSGVSVTYAGGGGGAGYTGKTAGAGGAGGGAAGSVGSADGLPASSNSGGGGGSGGGVGGAGGSGIVIIRYRTAGEVGIITPQTAGKVQQIVNVQTGAVATGTTVMPSDDSIPQNTEGNEYMTLAITPTSATNKLVIEVLFNGQSSAAGGFMCALFQDSTAGALAASWVQQTTRNQMNLRHFMAAGTTSATTFKIRAGCEAGGTTTFNGYLSNRKMGGVFASSITITEYSV